MSGAWTGLNSVGTPFEFNAVASGSIGYPSGTAAGKILFCAYHAGPTGQAAPTLADTDFQLIVSRTTNASSYLFWKVATGSEGSTMLVTRPTNSGQAYAEMCCFDGGPSTITGNVHATNTAGLGVTTGLGYPSLTITQPGCLVVVTGCKPANCSGFNVPSPFDAEIDEQHSAAGMCMVWDYKIQTTATNITAGTWTISSDASASRNAVIAALLPGVPDPQALLSWPKQTFVSETIVQF